jgi:pyridoxal 5'-phosphate synthase pdxT subunit
MTVQTNSVGILALQGDYFEHGRVLKKLGHKFIYVKTSDELAQVGSLILPGGESTTMRKLAKENGLWDKLKNFKGSILGTCAGIILLAKEITGQSEDSLGLLDVAIARNAYGSQVNSFDAIGKYIPKDKDIEMVFIRAPQIARVGERCKIIAEYDGKPVGIQQGKIIGLTFHPELSKHFDIIQQFLELK